MSLIRHFTKFSGICAVLLLASSAFADVVKPGGSFEVPSSDLIQDLDEPSANDVKQLSELLSHRIETAQAMHAGDDEVSEPVGDDF